MDEWMGMPPPGLRAASRIKPGQEAGLDGWGGDDTTAELPAVPGSPEPARLLQHGLAAR